MTAWEDWEEFHNALSAAPLLGSTEDVDVSDKTIYVRITATNSPAEWLVAEYEPDLGIAFGWCDLGVGFPEWGYVTVDELLNLDVEVSPGAHVRIEHDLDFEPTRFGDLGRA